MRLTKSVSALGLALLLLGALGLTALAETWYVPADFVNISEAVAAATEGDTIIVTMQTYNPGGEAYPINIDKENLTIQCQPYGTRALTVPQSHAGFVVRANGVTIKDCRLSGGGDIGVVVKEVIERVLIENLTITNMDIGIKVLNANDVTLRNNAINNVAIGIMLEASTRNTLSGNSVNATCDEGLFLFDSSSNTVTDDTYDGCKTNGVTLNDSDHNILEGLKVTDNRGWGVDISLSSYNEVNGSEISRNKAGGVKIEGGQENLVSNPQKRGNNIHDNGDGQDEDIQVLITSGEKVLFTVPDFLKVPDDPFDTKPNDVRTEAAAVREKIDTLGDKIVAVEDELIELRTKLDAANGIISQLSRTFRTDDKNRLIEKLEEIALEKFIIMFCKIGTESLVGEGFTAKDMPTWEQNSVETWIDGDWDKDGIFNEIPDDLCLAARSRGLLPSIFQVTIEYEKQEIKDEVEEIKEKIRRLTSAGLIEPDEQNELLQKLDTVIGIVLDVNAELDMIMKKLWIADVRLPEPNDVNNCLNKTTDPAKRACLESFLKRRISYSYFMLTSIFQENPWTLSGQGFQVDEAQSGSLEVVEAFDPNPITIPPTEVEVTEVERGCGNEVAGKVTCFKSLKIENSGPEDVVINFSFYGIDAYPTALGCGASPSPQETMKIPAGGETTCGWVAISPVGGTMRTDLVVYIDRNKVTELFYNPSVIDAKLWVEEAIREIPPIFDGKLEKFENPDDRRADKLDRMLSWMAHFSRQLPLPPFEINCVDYDDGLGCLIGKKEKGGTPITPGEIDAIKGELVGKLNADPQAQAFRLLLKGSKTWVSADIINTKINGGESEGNVIANNAITTNVNNPNKCYIPEKHPLVGSVERKCNIGIKIESPRNIFLNNLLTNEDIINGKRPPAAPLQRMDIGIIILSDENLIFHNTCEYINTCIIRGGNNDRDDVQHEHLFTKLAVTACGDEEDPLECLRPTEKVIVLGLVRDKTIHVSKPNDKKTGCGPDYYCSIKVARNLIVLNFFEHNGIDIDNIDVESNIIDENLFMDSGNGILAREGAALGFRLFHNDFINSAIRNNDPNLQLNASSNFGLNTAVIGNVLPPGMPDPFCQTENFGNEAKFVALERTVKALNAAASFHHYYTGGLAPNTDYLPVKVKLPPQKPRTCSDAIGTIPPAPGAEKLSEILDAMDELLNGGSIIPNLTDLAAKLLAASRARTLGDLQDLVDEAEEIKLTLWEEIAEFRVLLEAKALEHPACTTKIRVVLLTIERLLDRLEGYLDQVNNYMDEAQEQTSLTRAQSKVRLALAKARTALGTARSIKTQLNRAIGLVPAGKALAIEPLLVNAIGLRQAGSGFTFVVQGSGVAGIGVQIFNLQGRAVFAQEAFGTALRFFGLSDRGELLANGVYLYVVTVKGYDGSVIRSEVRKLAIVR